MDFIDDFIKEYKSSPCLWKADCADFKNRTKRQEAYAKLINVANKHGEHYNVERTKQKINNLRCAFRHQLKKYNELKKKGEKYEPYCPKRRYFESLMFLKDEEIPDKRTKRETKHIKQTSPAECAQNDNFEEYSDPEGNKRHIDAGKPTVNTNEQICSNIFEDTAPSSDAIISISKPGISIKEVEVIVPPESIESTNESKCGNISNNLIEVTNVTKDHIDSKFFELEKDNLLRPSQSQICSRKRSSSVSSRMSNELDTTPTKPLKADISTVDFERLLSLAFKSVGNGMDDHFTNFGKIIAHKLRSMDATQAIYAEKIIGDVLYQGQMKMLSTLSINQFLSTDHMSVYAENHNK